MPIILAIEPDRRQRRALDAVVHERVGAELILADTTEHALEAIGNRMPDLVLVPALLSPQDDAALAAALRVIAAAAHVRTLTIPVLANESKTEAPSGLLSRWRRGRNASQAPDGCDPHVFAEQISAYLTEAATERAALRRDADDVDDTPIAAKPVVDPAILEAAIVEAVSLSHAATSDEVADYRMDGHVVENNTVAPVMFGDYAPVDRAIVEEPAVGFASATPEPFFAAIEAQEHVSPIEVRDEQHGKDDFYADDDIELSSELFDGDPVGAYTMREAGDSTAADQPMVEEVGATASVVDQPIVEEVVATASVVDEPVVEELAVEHVLVDEPLTEEVALVAATDEPAIEELAVEATSDDAFSIGDIAAVEEFSVVDVTAVEEFSVVDVPAIEEFSLEAVSVESMAADIAAIDNLAVDLAPAEVLSVDTPHAEVLTIDEFAIDDLVEDFSFEEIAAELPAAKDLVRTPMVDEPAVALHVLEARAAFEQAEVVALADVDEDDAVLTEFADYAGPDPDDVEPWISASLARLYAWPALEGVPAEIVIEPIKPEPARPVAAAATHTREREWTELVASLRQDIERRRVEPVTPKAKRPSKKAKPAQDEWGFFDPEQCGFAALLAKLDEITDPPSEERDLPRH